MLLKVGGGGFTAALSLQEVMSAGCAERRVAALAQPPVHTPLPCHHQKLPSLGHFTSATD